MTSDKPFVLRLAVQRKLPFSDQYVTDNEVTKFYATKQGLMQAAHYWARVYQYEGKLWYGGYYTNYVLFTTCGLFRLVLHAYQQNATSDYQALGIDLTSIVSRKGLGQDIRGNAYKNVSSSKVGA